MIPLLEHPTVLVDRSTHRVHRLRLESQQQVSIRSLDDGGSTRDIEERYRRVTWEFTARVCAVPSDAWEPDTAFHMHDLSSASSSETIPHASAGPSANRLGAVDRFTEDVSVAGVLGSLGEDVQERLRLCPLMWCS